MHHSISQHVTAQCIPHHYTAIVHITPPQVFSILHNHTTFYTTPHCTTTSRHTTFHIAQPHVAYHSCILHHTDAFHITPPHGNNIAPHLITAFYIAPHLKSHHIPPCTIPYHTNTSHISHRPTSHHHVSCHTNTSRIVWG